MVLVFVSAVNRDKQITRYNIAHAGPNKPLDVYYLTYELSNANLPELVQLYNDKKLNRSERKNLYVKLQRAYKDNRFRQWQSFNLREAASNKALIDLQIN